VHPAFEILEHPADIGFRAWGRTREELFENAALALFSLVCDPATIAEKETREVAATASEPETLLYAWLAELLAIGEAERLVFRRAVVSPFCVTAKRSSGGAERVHGTAHGERFDHARHPTGTNIKAVTMHQLEVEETSEGWRAQVFLDL
jgi:SHS2 domain-containing protein